MIELLKGLTDTHKYEIDTEKLKKVYNEKKKSESEYEIYQSKIIFSREKQTKNDLSRSEIENRYYSNYKFFREYLSNGFEGEEIKEEIVEIRKLLDYSKKIKESSEKFLNKDENALKSSTGKKNYFHNFIDMCKLFAVKKEKEKVKNHPEFTLFSELKIPSDVFSMSLNENFLNNKLMHYKKKLYKSYYKEEFLSNYTNHHVKGKSNNNSVNESFKLSPDIKEKFPVEYLDMTFRGRDSDIFCNLNTFMSMYNTKKLSNNEKDLYENIYAILSKSNYVNFMSFLYSKNDLFKYIFDEFTTKKHSFDESLDNIKLSRLDSVQTENLFKGSSYYSMSPDVNPKSSKIRNTFKNFRDIDDLVGNYYFDKIFINFDKIDDKIFEIYTQKSKIHKDHTKELAITHIKTLCNKIYFSLIVITKNEKLKLIQTIEELEMNQHIPLQNVKPNEIEEDLKKVQFYRIEKKTLSDIVSMNMNDIDSFKNCNFYIIELKTSPKSSYYLVRISSEYSKRLEIAINSFDLYRSSIDRNFTINNNYTIDNNKSLENYSNRGGAHNDEKSENFSKKDSLLFQIKDPPKKEERPDKITLGDDKNKKSIATIYKQLNESDHLGDLPEGEDLLYNAIFKSKKQNEEKIKIEDDYNNKGDFGKNKSSHNNIPNTNEFGRKLEENAYLESETKVNEVYSFNMDSKNYKFKITKKGLEYITKTHFEGDKWNVIEYSNIIEFECISEEKLPSYKVIFTMKLKNKMNDKDKHKLIGENENEYIKFSKKLENWFIKDKSI